MFRKSPVTRGNPVGKVDKAPSCGFASVIVSSPSLSTLYDSSNELPGVSSSRATQSGPSSSSSSTSSSYSVCSISSANSSATLSSPPCCSETFLTFDFEQPRSSSSMTISSSQFSSNMPSLSSSLYSSSLPSSPSPLLDVNQASASPKHSAPMVSSSTSSSPAPDATSVAALPTHGLIMPDSDFATGIRNSGDRIVPLKASTAKAEPVSNLTTVTSDPGPITTTVSTTITSPSTSPTAHPSPTKTATTGFPLNDLDYESSPAAVAQELSNLQAIRRMSMDVNTIDPDLPSFESGFKVSGISSLAGFDDQDPSRLFWVPARVHPELAPKEFKDFIEDRMKSLKRRSGKVNDLVLGGITLDRNASFNGLRRKKSMLSRQIDNANGYQDGAERLERKRSQAAASRGVDNVVNLQELEQLVNDPSSLVRSLSIDASRRAGQSDTTTCDSAVEIDQDVLLFPQLSGSSSLKRSTRTTYRRGSLKKGMERSNYSNRAVSRSKVNPNDGNSYLPPSETIPDSSEHLLSEGTRETTRAASATITNVNHLASHPPFSSETSCNDGAADSVGHLPLHRSVTDSNLHALGQQRNIEIFPRHTRRTDPSLNDESISSKIVMDTLSDCASNEDVEHGIETLDNVSHGSLTNTRMGFERKPVLNNLGNDKEALANSTTGVFNTVPSIKVDDGTLDDHVQGSKSSYSGSERTTNVPGNGTENSVTTHLIKSPRHYSRQNGNSRRHKNQLSSSVTANQTLDDMTSYLSPLPGNSNRTDSLSFIPTLHEDKKSVDKKREKFIQSNDSGTSGNGTTINGGSKKSSWWSFGDTKDKDESRKAKSKLLKLSERNDINRLEANVDGKNAASESWNFTGSVGNGIGTMERDSAKPDEKVRMKESSRKVLGDVKKEKESGIFSTLFGVSKKKGWTPGSRSGKNHGNLRSTYSPEPPPRQLRPDVDYNWTRFSILEERTIYRMAHIKLANPRRELYSQVLLSNFMYSYLAKVQQMHPQIQIPHNAAQRQAQRQAAAAAAQIQQQQLSPSPSSTVPSSPVALSSPASLTPSVSSHIPIQQQPTVIQVSSSLAANSALPGMAQPVLTGGVSGVQPFASNHPPAMMFNPQRPVDEFPMRLQLTGVPSANLSYSNSSNPETSPRNESGSTPALHQPDPTAITQLCYQDVNG